jgi:hypothetical protein
MRQLREELRSSMTSLSSELGGIGAEPRQASDK